MSHRPPNRLVLIHFSVSPSECCLVPGPAEGGARLNSRGSGPPCLIAATWPFAARGKEQAFGDHLLCVGLAAGTIDTTCRTPTTAPHLTSF